MLRLFLVILSLFIFNAFLSRAEIQKDHPKMLKSKGQVEALIKQEMPIGTKRDAVEAILDRYGLVHSYLADERMVGAIVKDIESSLFGLITESLQLKFRFDERDRLQSYSIESVYTGP